MSSLGGRLKVGGRLREFRPYWVKNVASLAYENKLTPCSPSLRITFPSLVLPRNAIWLQHLIIQFTLYYLSNGRLREECSNNLFYVVTQGVAAHSSDSSAHDKSV